MLRVWTWRRDTLRTRLGGPWDVADFAALAEARAYLETARPFCRAWTLPEPASVDAGPPDTAAIFYRTHIRGRACIVSVPGREN